MKIVVKIQSLFQSYLIRKSIQYFKVKKIFQIHADYTLVSQTHTHTHCMFNMMIMKTTQYIDDDNK